VLCVCLQSNWVLAARSLLGIEIDEGLFDHQLIEQRPDTFGRRRCGRIVVKSFCLTLSSRRCQLRLAVEQTKPDGQVGARPSSIHRRRRRMTMASGLNGRLEPQLGLLAGRVGL
jgi:hypothetical protein